MSEEPEVEPEETSEPATAFEGLSREDLSKLIDGVADEPAPTEEPKAEEPAEPAETPEPEEPAEDPDEDPKPQPVDKEPAPAAPPDTVLMQARLDEALARAKQMESVAGRHAGELGYIKRQNQTLMDQISRLTESIRRGQVVDDPQDQPIPQRHVAEATVDPNAAYLSAKAVEESYLGFISRHPSAMVDQDSNGTKVRVLDPLLANEILKRREDLLALRGSGHAPEASTLTEQILAEAWSNVEVQRAAQRVQEVERRSADQSNIRLKNKKAQAAAGVSSRSAAPAPRKVSSFRDLKNDELKALIDSRAGLEP